MTPPAAAEPEKAKRKSHSKKRSGCITCKIRHVKCDEGKPSCLKCTQSGFQCDGYINPKKSSAIAAPKILPKPIVQYIEYPLSHFQGSRRDQRSFEFFRSVTAPMLCCNFDEDFWDHFILQMSRCEPTVWHSVLALGTLHEQDSLDDPNLRAEYHRNALNHYNKAISRLVKPAKGDTQSIEVILVSCVIFVCVEIALGNIEGAITHLQGGIQIIRSRKTRDYVPSLYHSNSQLIETNVVPILDHLNNHTFIYGRVSPPTSEQSLDFADDIPEIFSEPRQVRASLTKLLIGAQQFAVKSMKVDDQDSEQYACLLGQKQNLQARVHNWASAVEDLLRSPHLKPSDRKKIPFLQLSHKVAAIWICNALHTDETSFDAYVQDYDSVVKVSKMTFNKWDINLDKPQASPRVRNYSLQLQSVSPLFLVATKCRNPAIRREALTLLRRSPSREGFWDSKMINRVVERVIELEEEGLEDLTDPTGSIVPSEWARIQSMSVNLGKSDDTKIVVIFRRKSGVIEEQLSRSQDVKCDIR